MRQKILTLLSLLAVTIINAQIIRISNHDGKTLNVCKGQFVSSEFTNAKEMLGNPPRAGYKNNENYTVSLCSSQGTKLRTNFYYIGLGSGDHLYIYDGPSITSPLLHHYSNIQKQYPTPGVFTTSTGTCLTFQFVSDNNAADNTYGWDAFIGCTPTACIGNPPASDECITATEICNLGGYCGSTSGWYTRGAEAPTLDNPGAFCALIQNNSWLSFNAASTSASFDITASNCSDSSTGVQAAIFETTNYTNFTLKSTCYNNAQGNFTLTTISPLSVGKKYYIMIDGFDGNDCEYTIKAKSGVATLSITANTSNTLCTSQPLVLTANATGVGLFTYKWSPVPIIGKDSAVATFPVATGITYSCTVTGVCGLPTTQTYTPSVVTTPIITAIDSARICPGGNGTTIAATLFGSSPTIDFKNVTTETILDNNPSGISSDIYVGTLTGTISNQLLKVGVNINHGNVSELEISLKTPDGDVMILSSGNGLIGANFTNTYFTPTSNKVLSTGVAPFTDNFAPQDPFSKISTGKINGKWSLIVKDKKALGTGLLTGWSLSFQNDFTYAWSPSLGLSTTTGTSVIANPTSTTTYTATVTDKAGCSGLKTVKVNVTVPTKPLVISPVIYCEGDSPLKLTATGNDLLWYAAATGGTGSSTAPTPSTSKADTLYFYVSEKTLTCEGEREKITVIINPAPKLSSSKTTSVCSGIQLNIPLASTINNTLWSWKATDNTNTTGETYATSVTTNLINDVVVNNTTNVQLVKYTVTLTVAGTGCVNITPQAIDVTVNPKPVADTSALVINASSCGTNSGSITGIAIASGIAPLKYVWKDVLGNTIGTTLNLQTVNVGTYVLTITDANGCITQVGAGKNLNIISKNKVKAAFTLNSSIGEMPVEVQFTNASIGAINYDWNFGNGATSGDQDPLYTYNQLGSFKACLIANDGGKCFDTICSTIVVYVNSRFTIPNVFTPNNDGTNDLFSILGKGIASLHAEVYNRWGQKQYEWDTPNGGWDGRSASGQTSPAGTYFVIIKAKGMDGKDLLEKGSFTLLR